MLSTNIRTAKRYGLCELGVGLMRDMANATDDQDIPIADILERGHLEFAVDSLRFVPPSQHGERDKVAIELSAQCVERAIAHVKRSLPRFEEQFPGNAPVGEAVAVAEMILGLIRQDAEPEALKAASLAALDSMAAVLTTARSLVDRVNDDNVSAAATTVLVYDACEAASIACLVPATPKMNRRFDSDVVLLVLSVAAKVAGNAALPRENNGAEREREQQTAILRSLLTA